MSPIRLCAVILGFLLFVACDDEPYPQRSEPHQAREENGGRDGLEHADSTNDASVRALDGGALFPDKPDLMPALDAGSPGSPVQPVSQPVCQRPFQFFWPGCGVKGAEGRDPERWPVWISAGCYRRCSGAQDSLCEGGTRCGIAGIAPCVCSGVCCASVCAEVWLCLPEHYFPDPEQDAGVDDDAGVDVR